MTSAGALIAGLSGLGLFALAVAYLSGWLFPARHIEAKHTAPAADDIAKHTADVIGRGVVRIIRHERARSNEELGLVQAGLAAAERRLAALERRPTGPLSPRPAAGSGGTPVFPRASTLGSESSPVPAAASEKDFKAASPETPEEQFRRLARAKRESAADVMSSPQMPPPSPIPPSEQGSKTSIDLDKIWDQPERTSA